jgi:hypothetical protein
MKAARLCAGVVAALLVGAGCGSNKDNPKKVGPFQVTGDPPVTVSDGSLHAHSKNGWQGDAASSQNKLQPNPTGGTLTANCKLMTGLNDAGNSNLAAATFWADDHESWDISPQAGGSTRVEITYSSKNDTGGHPLVIITAQQNGLAIETQDDSFEPEPTSSDQHDRAHSRKGEVEQIKITGAQYHNNAVWSPQNPQHPHFTLGFCYN